MLSSSSPDCSSPKLARLPAAGPDALEHIRQLDLIHFSHTDYGFTDHPAVCRDLQRRYLDIALDTALATRHLPEEARFRWTAETTVAVDDWWQAASPARRKQFLKAVRAGQIEVTALPLNNTPFLDRDQWQTMTHWLPEELWQEFKPQTAVQNDVNGFPRAGRQGAARPRRALPVHRHQRATAAAPPLPRLTAFWWKQPDGRRLFVWMSLSYGDGFFFFETEEWRRGPAAAGGRRALSPAARRRHPQDRRSLAAQGAPALPRAPAPVRAATATGIPCCPSP